MAIQYKKYNLNLDPDDKDDKQLIEFLNNAQDHKRKNSYSAILKKALKIYKEIEEGKLKTVER